MPPVVNGDSHAVLIPLHVRVSDKATRNVFYGPTRAYHPEVDGCEAKLWTLRPLWWKWSPYHTVVGYKAHKDGY